MREKLNRIRAVTFDFWGTLALDTLEVRTDELRVRLIQKYFAGQDGIAAAVPRAFQNMIDEFYRAYEQERRTMSTREALRLVLQQVHAALPPEREDALVREIEDAFFDNLPPLMPGAGDAVRICAKRFKVGIVSDTGFSTGRVIRQWLEKENILDCFSSLTFSDETGISKPNLGAFEDAARKLGVAFGEILHIGDRLDTDISGANSAGMFSAHYAYAPKNIVSDAAPHLQFSSWEEFCALISKK